MSRLLQNQISVADIRRIQEEVRNIKRQTKLFNDRNSIISSNNFFDKDSIIENNENDDDVEIIEFDGKYIDPAKWPKHLTQLEIEFIVDMGPKRVYLPSYPLNKNKKCFNEDMYLRRHRKDTADRTWLVYSESKDAIFCVCCLLFSSRNEDPFGSTGYRDWHYARSKLVLHECTASHADSISKWNTTEKKIRESKPRIDRNIIIL